MKLVQGVICGEKAVGGGGGAEYKKMRKNWLKLENKLRKIDFPRQFEG